MKTLARFDELLPDEDACKRLLVSMRWPNGPECPRCGNTKVYALKARPFHWVCKSGEQTTTLDGETVVCAKNGGYRFSIITHTIFQDTKIPLKLWFKIAYLMLQSKKGMSALQIHRTIFGEESGSDYRTSWYICTRLRAAMKGDVLPPFTGIVEIDETGIGGKDKNRHWDKKQHITGLTGKTTVIGAISRKGNVTCKVIENTDASTLNGFVRKTVSGSVDLVVTDEHRGYDHLKADGLPHETIAHSAGEYVRGNVHTNSIESFWALLKRGIVGTFHNVSKDYLPLYLNEFSFRHNHRKDPNMFEALLQNV